jgi:HPt (histidine-containing phosphotransfer) domain-containing protein
MVALYLEDSAGKLDKLAAALAPGAAAALAPGAAAELYGVVHQLKGSSASIGASRVTATCVAFHSAAQATDVGAMRALLGVLASEFVQASAARAAPSAGPCARALTRRCARAGARHAVGDLEPGAAGEGGGAGGLRLKERGGRMGWRGRDTHTHTHTHARTHTHVRSGAAGGSAARRGAHAGARTRRGAARRASCSWHAPRARCAHRAARAL